MEVNLAVMPPPRIEERIGELSFPPSSPTPWGFYNFHELQMLFEYALVGIRSPG